MSEEIKSPPYPGPGATWRGLYHALYELHDWVVLHRDAVNAAVGRDVVPPVAEAVPLPVAYMSLAVSIQYAHLLYLRRVREEWDHLVRQYESAWDCPACIRARASLTQLAATLVNGAFVPYEQREASGRDTHERMVRSFESVLSHLTQLQDPAAEGG